MSIAPFWMEVSPKTPERFIEKDIIDHRHYHPMPNVFDAQPPALLGAPVGCCVVLGGVCTCSMEHAFFM